MISTTHPVHPCAMAVAYRPFSRLTWLNGFATRPFPRSHFRGEQRPNHERNAQPFKKNDHVPVYGSSHITHIVYPTLPLHLFSMRVVVHSSCQRLGPCSLWRRPRLTSKKSRCQTFSMEAGSCPDLCHEAIVGCTSSLQR